METKENDKHIYGTEEERKKALKDLKKRYEDHRMKYPEYVLQTKYIEKYWVIKDPEPETQSTLEIKPMPEGTPTPTLGEIVEPVKPLDLTGAFGK